MKLTEIPILSGKEVLNTLALFLENGSYDKEELLYFVSSLLGMSEDEILNQIEKNHLPDSEIMNEVLPENQVIPRDQLMAMFTSYVNNDAEAADLEYVQNALEQVGCGKEDAKKLGLDWIWPE